MLKHSIFSNEYLQHRLDKSSQDQHEVQGTLAMASSKNKNNNLPICRTSPRTWWETAWKTRKG